MRELESLIEEAEETGNKTEALRMRKRKEEVEDFSQKALGLGGRSRKVSDPNEKWRKAI